MCHPWVIFRYYYSSYRLWVSLLRLPCDSLDRFVWVMSDVPLGSDPVLHSLSRPKDSAIARLWYLCRLMYWIVTKHPERLTGLEPPEEIRTSIDRRSQPPSETCHCEVFRLTGTDEETFIIKSVRVPQASRLVYEIIWGKTGKHKYFDHRRIDSYIVVKEEVW